MLQTRYSHIDLTVDSFDRCIPFYEKILPALGFTRTFHSQKWRAWAAEGDLPEVTYFAITEDPNHRPNANLVGFWAHDRDEVDRFARLVTESGGKIIDGPRQFPISPTYYSIYFEDPSGNRFEFLYRTN